MREFLIAGNWKMNGSMAANKELVAGIIDGVPVGGGFSLLVCPPFPYIAAIAAQAHGSAVSVGAQNVSEHEKGAFTGEVAPAMLRELGCEYVIVGHSEQLDAVLDAAGIEAFAAAVIAYEPVWAIGTGRTATPEQAQDVHRHIRERLARHDENIAAGVRILYGGSMKGDNAAGLLAKPDIDGGLIGGASLKADDFLAIAKAAVRD